MHSSSFPIALQFERSSAGGKALACCSSKAPGRSSGEGAARHVVLGGQLSWALSTRRLRPSVEASWLEPSLRLV